MQDMTTDDWRQLDAAHHMAPFTDYRELRATGSRIITHADGHYIYDSDGNRILDAMAGLWCVNVGYGRQEYWLMPPHHRWRRCPITIIFLKPVISQ